VQVPRRTVGAAAAVLAAAGLSLLTAGPAQAATCAHISITPGVQSPALSPKTATITAGGCAAYTNNTALPVKVSVGKLSDIANPNGVVTFVERVPGSFAVSVQEQFQGQGVGGTGTGTLVVRPAPAPKPSPTKTASPAPHPSTSASTSPHPSASAGSSGPVVAPSTAKPPTPTAPGVTPVPTNSGQGNPPVIVGMPPPTATPSAPPESVARAQIQPPSGRAAGLPAAVAAVLLVGTGAAFVRVLLAEPARAGSSPAGDERRFVPRPS
jgi:hypothetical protein